MIDGSQKEYWFDGKIAVVGKYNNTKCCGVDAGNYSCDVFLKTIECIIKAIKPYIIIFEGIRLSDSFAFKERMNNLSRRNNYVYVIVNLITSPECSCNRVLNRSGCFDNNYDAIISKARGVIKSSKRAKSIGAKVLFFDTEKNDQGETFRFLLNVINE